jgi:hypothetical protein
MMCCRRGFSPDTWSRLKPLLQLGFDFKEERKHGRNRTEEGQD